MAKYPLFDDEAPWIDNDEMSFDMTLDGQTIQGIPFFTDIPEQLQLGLGLEASNPYVLVQQSQLEDLGLFADVHGKTLVFDGKNYRVRNIVKKSLVDTVRLVLVEL